MHRTNNIKCCERGSSTAKCGNFLTRLETACSEGRLNSKKLIMITQLSISTHAQLRHRLKFIKII